MQQPVDAAVAIVRTRGPEPSILLMRRAERAGDAWSGHWSLPGGRCEAGDSDLLDTAIRELKEECGIQLSRDQMAEALPPTLARRRTGRFLLVAPFVFEIETEIPAQVDGKEAIGTAWLPQRIVQDPMQHRLMNAPARPPEELFPSIDLPGVPLWGFTYRLLVDWLGVAPRQGAAPGFKVAHRILEFLQLQGLTVQGPWYSMLPRAANESGPLHIARVNGPIPVLAVMEHLSAPGKCAAHVNRIEVRPEFIRVHGLDFEEYLIEAALPECV
ncbi:MAG: NUDIX domain-containing protein [Bryobacterales bacterium]|nr:NUDIX domain-containing protein [Bryobacterales bacterium]